MPLVIVQLNADMAAAWRSGQPLAALDTLRAAARQHGVTLAAQHPGTADRALGRYLQADVPDGDAEAVAGTLRGVAGVDAAYVEPGPVVS